MLPAHDMEGGSNCAEVVVRDLMQWTATHDTLIRTSLVVMAPAPDPEVSGILMKGTMGCGVHIVGLYSAFAFSTSCAGLCGVGRVATLYRPADYPMGDDALSARVAVRPESWTGTYT